VRAGRTEYESYGAGGGPSTVRALASGTKTFCGLVAVAAVADGLLALDEPCSQTLVAWREDPARAAITVRQLLMLVGGLDPLPGVLDPKLGAPSGDQFQAALAAPVLAAPGTRFDYGPVPFLVFGEIMNRKLAARGSDVERYLNARVLAPIGARVAGWLRDDAGQPHLAGGAGMTARDWSRVGRLIVADGRWGRRRVLDAGLLRDARSAGSAANRAYGLTFWRNAPGLTARAVAGPGPGTPTRRPIILPGGPNDLVMAAGAGNQRLYLFPSSDLVIVRQAPVRAGQQAGGWSDAEFLELALAAER